MCRVFLWPTRRRSPKEDYMHHRDVELKAIRLQSTKERRDTSYPRRGTPLKEPIRGCASVQSMVLSVLSVLNKIFGCMRTSQSKYYSRTLNNRPLIRNNTYKIFFIDKLRVSSWGVKKTVTRNLTNEIAVVIRVPPDAPTAKRGTPLLSTNIEGVIEDIGRFPALIKLLSDGSTPKLFFLPGVEKSSISLL